MRLLWQVWKNKAYNWCYIISNLNAMSLLTGKEVSDAKYEKFLNDMMRKWHNPDFGKFIESWPNRTIPRWKENMGDIITVSQIKILTTQFWVNILKWVPMVLSINVWDQFRLDREDGTLHDTQFTDKVKSGHAIVIKWLRLYDSRWDQKTYSFTRQYLTNVQGLLKSRNVLVFQKW